MPEVIDQNFCIYLAQLSSLTAVCESQEAFEALYGPLQPQQKPGINIFPNFVCRICRFREPELEVLAEPESTPEEAARRFLL